MPGLFGRMSYPAAGLDPDPAADLRLLDSMAARLRRHPDEIVDIHVDPAGRFAVGRIGMAHASGRPWPCELQGDALRLYAIGHPDVDPQGGLGGRYAALIDRRGETPFLQADRIAGHPIFYREAGGDVYFAPEAAALLDIAGTARTIDLGTFGYFLGAGQLCPQRSLFEGLRRLHGGGRLRMGPSGPMVETHWRFAPGSRGVRAGSTEALSEELAHLIRLEVSRHYQSPETTVLFLSGGADSRALLGAALDIPGLERSKIFTVTWADYVKSVQGDVAIARQIAAATGIQHEVITRDWSHYEESFTNTNRLLGGSQMAIDHPNEFSIMKDLYDKGCRKTIRGDQCFYSRHIPADISHAIETVGVFAIYNDPNLRDLITKSYRDEIISQNESIFSSIANIYRDLDLVSAVNAIYFDLRLQNYILRAAYWRQIFFDEAQPFLSDSVLDFAMETPDAFRSRKEGFYQTGDRLWNGKPTIPKGIDYELWNFHAALRSVPGVLQYASRQMGDKDSPFWNYIDINHANRMFESLIRQESGRRNLLREMLRGIRSKISVWNPTLGGAMSRAVKPGRRSTANIVASVIVLKNWFDENFHR